MTNPLAAPDVDAVGRPDGETLEDLTAAAERLVASLRERASQTEETGRVPEETIEELKQAKLFRAFVPRRYGGLELDYGRAQVEICNQLGRGCPSTAWVWNVIASHAWLLGMMPGPAQDAVWSAGPDVLMTTAISPADGRITRVDGGYRLNGTWQFSSGVDAAQWILFAGPLEGGSRAPWCLVPRDSWTIRAGSWDPAGLKGTGSKDVTVHDAFVPESWTSHVGERPGAALNKHWMYRLPMSPFFYINVSSPALGTARGAVEDCLAQIRERPNRATQPARQMHFAESSAGVDAALALMRSVTREVATIARTDAELPQELLARVERDIGYSTLLCVQAVDRLLPMLGAHAISRSNHVHRAGRDIQAISTHAGNWDVRGLAYARWAFGLEPEGGF